MTTPPELEEALKERLDRYRADIDKIHDDAMEKLEQATAKHIRVLTAVWVLWFIFAAALIGRATR